MTQGKGDFAIADTTETGYTKRNLAEVLENFVRAGIFEGFQVRNQKRYSFAKRDQMIKIMHPFPEFVPPWLLLLEVILRLRACIQSIENKSDGTKIVEIHNALGELEDKLHQLKLTPPVMQTDFSAYWESFAKWILGILPGISDSTNMGV